MKFHSLQEYIDAGCPEMKSPTYALLHVVTGGKICDTGCYAVAMCPAYRNLSSSELNKKAPDVVRGETVREEAKRKNLSISEVRRQRRKEAQP